MTNDELAKILNMAPEQLEEERTRLETIKQQFEMADEAISNEEFNTLLLNPTFFIPGNITNSTQLRTYIYTQWEENIKSLDSIKEIYDILMDTVQFNTKNQTGSIQCFIWSNAGADVASTGAARESWNSVSKDASSNIFRLIQLVISVGSPKVIFPICYHGWSTIAKS